MEFRACAVRCLGRDDRWATRVWPSIYTACMYAYTYCVYIGRDDRWATRVWPSIEYVCTCAYMYRIKIKKLKIALSFASPEKEKYFLFIYEVITWEIFHKRAANHY